MNPLHVFRRLGTIKIKGRDLALLAHRVQDSQLYPLKCLYLGSVFWSSLIRTPEINTEEFARIVNLASFQLSLVSNLQPGFQHILLFG